MIAKIEPEYLKTEFELTYILRWDDGLIEEGNRFVINLASYQPIPGIMQCKM